MDDDLWDNHSTIEYNIFFKYLFEKERRYDSHRERQRTLQRF